MGGAQLSDRPAWLLPGSWPARQPALRRGRPGWHPVFRNIGANSAAQESMRCILRPTRTTRWRAAGSHAFSRWSRSTASRSCRAAGDGLQPSHHLSLEDPSLGSAMSHVSVSSALALDARVSAGERLAAFSLASFANREHRAWPGTRVAAARAGLSRSQFIAARDSLARRGLLVIEQPGGGRGNSPVVFLSFAAEGPRVDTDVNPPLFEAVLSYSRSRGSARLLLAALAALADDDLTVADVTTEELRAAAGMADSTYRRARSALLLSGEVALENAGGGRARTNRWMLPDPRGEGAAPLMASPRRPALPGLARPLMATARVEPPAAEVNAAEDSGELSKGPVMNGVPPENPAQDWTDHTKKGPGSIGVSTRNSAQSRIVPTETQPLTPPETPPANARTGREPQNPSTIPPSPPAGGSQPQRITVVEDYLTARGRRRKRTVTVDTDAARRQLRPPGDYDRNGWAEIRRELQRVVGETTFDIWLAGLELIAVDDCDQLLLSAPVGIRSWVSQRFAQTLDRAAAQSGRVLRLADENELQLLSALVGEPHFFRDSLHQHQQEAV